jgi:hypothetical protein
MKRLYQVVISKNGPVKPWSVGPGSNGTMRPRLERRRGKRRVSQQQDYLRDTGGVDRRRGHGRRSDDPPTTLSFIGAFL